MGGRGGLGFSPRFRSISWTCTISPVTDRDTARNRLWRCVCCVVCVCTWTISPVTDRDTVQGTGLAGGCVCCVCACVCVYLDNVTYNRQGLCKGTGLAGGGVCVSVCTWTISPVTVRDAVQGQVCGEVCVCLCVPGQL